MVVAVAVDVGGGRISGVRSGADGGEIGSGSGGVAGDGEGGGGGRVAVAWESDKVRINWGMPCWRAASGRSSAYWR